jgi:hypothetical protein
MLLLLLWLPLAETELLTEAALLAEAHRVGVRVPLSVVDREMVWLEVGLSVPLLVLQRLSVNVLTGVGEAQGLTVRVALGKRLGLPLALMVSVGQGEGVSELAMVTEGLAPPEVLPQRVGVRVAEGHPELLLISVAEGRGLEVREEVWQLLAVAVPPAAWEPVMLRLPVLHAEGVGVPTIVTDRLAPLVLLAQKVGVGVAEEHPEVLLMAEAVGRLLEEWEAVWQLLPVAVPAAAGEAVASVPVLLALSASERLLPGEALAALLGDELMLEQPEEDAVAVTHLVAVLLPLALKVKLPVAVGEAVGQSVLERDGVALCDAVGLALAKLAEGVPEAEGRGEEVELGVWLRSSTSLRALLRLSATATPPTPLLSTLTPPGL